MHLWSRLGDNKEKELLENKLLENNYSKLLQALWNKLIGNYREDRVIDLEMNQSIHAFLL